MINAALEGALEDVPYRQDPVFGFKVPTRVPGVPAEVLDPRATWPDPAAYDEAAGKLARMFQENFAKYADLVGPEVRDAGPKTS
jgi:phosphoenolpyruvate carboxykinase (ATP)